MKLPWIGAVGGGGGKRAGGRDVRLGRGYAERGGGGGDGGGGALDGAAPAWAASGSIAVGSVVNGSGGGGSVRLFGGMLVLRGESDSFGVGDTCVSRVTVEVESVRADEGASLAGLDGLRTSVGR